MWQYRCSCQKGRHSRSSLSPSLSLCLFPSPSLSLSPPPHIEAIYKPSTGQRAASPDTAPVGPWILLGLLASGTVGGWTAVCNLPILGCFDMTHLISIWKIDFFPSHAIHKSQLHVSLKFKHENKPWKLQGDKTGSAYSLDVRNDERHP